MVTPVAVVATVTVVNTLSPGALQAWNGGTTLSGGAVVNWSGFDRDSNTTVIPMNRFIVAFPGSGSKRDIAVNNNSFSPIDVVIDVVGYFIDNLATPLECQVVLGPGFSLPAGTARYSTRQHVPRALPGLWGCRSPISSASMRERYWILLPHLQLPRRGRQRQLRRAMLPHPGPLT